MHFPEFLGPGGPVSNLNWRSMSESTMSGIQLISADMKFADEDEFCNYMESEGLRDKGNMYHIVSIIGGQSSGKSTLLNAMFGTKFDMMDSSRGRQQTTKGIWCAKAAGNNVLVMDVEGTDGREKEDQKAFEGKSALFSLALTDVLMVNMWMNEVGRYNAANLPLLKTVFEVHLKLLQGSRQALKSKPLLLFILRDCDGSTTLENLQGTIMKDLLKIWTDMSKPDEYSDSALEDFFQVQCEELPHYKFQRAEWDQRVKEIANFFSDKNGVFKDRSSKEVPAEGFPQYASQLWKTIESDGDLDLPTQRKMLSMVRCENKRRQATVALDEECKKWVHDVDADTFKSRIEAEIGRVISEFKENTIGYDEEIRQESAKKLEADIWPKLEEPYEKFVRAVYDSVTQTFSSSLDTFMPAKGEMPQLGCSSRINEFLDAAKKDFRSRAEALLPSNSPWNLYEKLTSLEQDLRRDEITLKKQLATHAQATCERKLQEWLSRRLVPLLDEAAPEMWAQVRKARDGAVKLFADELKRTLDDIGIPDRDENASYGMMQSFADRLTNDKFIDKAQEASLAKKIFEKFDMAFNRGRSRVWRLWDSPDQDIVKARALGSLVLEMFSASQLYEDGSWPAGQAKIAYIDEARKEGLAQDFEARAQQELCWAQVTRSNSSTHSSVIVAALVLVLGWNEILWLICNPIQLILIIMAICGGGVYYFLNRVGDWQQLVAFVLKIIMQLMNPPAGPSEPSSATSANTAGADPLAHAAHLAGPPGREKRPSTAPAAGSSRATPS